MLNYKYILLITLFFYLFATHSILSFNSDQYFSIHSNTYAETIAFYEHLAEKHKTVNIQTIGKTDSGYPLHLVTFNPDKQFDFSDLQKSKTIILINNGIHPGEPDGIEATMRFFEDLATGKINAPKNTVIAAIPVYNIGGALNRNSTTRVNQNGPEEYGFRGNARNYDLNRDFIKADSRNARAFAELFHYVSPDVFIDNHVSNGADYQYTITHLFTQHNKLGGELGNFLNANFIPEVEKTLTANNWISTPYVNVFNRPPDDGFTQFFDHPRFSTGYTALFNTLGMMVETHMLKPYPQRVDGTYAIMKSMLEVTDAHHQTIKTLRKNANNRFKTGTSYAVQWEIDSTQHTQLNFKGFEAEYKTSNVTGLQRLFYNREKPFTKEINYYNYFKPKVEVTIPKAYIIPQGWWNIIELLELNQIEMTQLKKDTIIKTEMYSIEKYDTANAPFEGHYLHSNTQVSSTVENRLVKKGDYIVFAQQPGIRYLLETLEPQAVDSFFNWNFFDTILQQKEWFSAYVFEEIAEQMLKDDPKLKARFEEKRKEDSSFRENAFAQLNWLHKQSVHYEKAHLNYPILRILE